ncbi:hypothetical protein [Pelagibacterium montanilacus]|uniref:hypothetical protein n=1 Tax=Pelagibacterium montanilacus TaxID=2185280 RepID=UPI000F8C7253|nr:hypothetical protein [Pelagibacterium montanilacus]
MTSIQRLVAAAGDGTPQNEQIQWAKREVGLALEANPLGPKGLAIAMGAAEEVRAAADRVGVRLEEAAESLALFTEDDVLYAWGADMRGLVFALTEIADRIVHSSDGQLGHFPLAETPAAPIRSMARLFCSEQEDKPWFYDRQGWRDYLSMLAYNRFNRFSLTLGMGYNYPYHNAWITDVYFYFPYPFLIDVPGHNVRVSGLSDDERRDNLEMLKFIGREARRRGLDFQLALWTQRYDFEDCPRANHAITGITDDTLAPYCRKAISSLLRECPQITGLTFRVHVEGGIAEGDYGFWEQAFAGVADCGRPVEIDMHAKGLDHRMIDIARASGMPITVSPKYLAEHMGPPYHQSAIREKEYPPETARSQREQLSEGSRKFLRYSYGDLLARDRDYKVLYRIWPGTQRFLLWGDPAMAAGYGRSSQFCGSDGVEWCEPLSFKGRMGTTMAGQRAGYSKQGLATGRDWERYAYQYRVWGRLIYNPDAPRESWMRYLKRECGDAAEPCERALALASRILPLITLTHGPSASNNFYWPEIYTNLPLLEGSGRRAYAFDMEGPLRFGNAPTFDSMLFATAREFVAELHEVGTCTRYTPLDVADWLDGLAQGCEAELAAMGSGVGASGETKRIRGDVGILAGMARYFAAKFRAACWAELYVLTGASTLIDIMIAHMEVAVEGWRGAAAVSRELFPDDITFGPQSWLRGSWHGRLAEIEAELLELEAIRGAHVETVRPDEKGQRTADAILGRPATGSDELAEDMPSTFRAGEDVVVKVRGEASAARVLHYRHVNQAERWQSVAMTWEAGRFSAVIPGAYTDSRFPLQCFVSGQSAGRTVLSPGLDANFSNEPYYTLAQVD